MTIDFVGRILAEDLLTFSQVAKEIQEQQPGSRLHVATVHRWALRGCRGTKLEAVRVGGRWMTSRQSVHRFLRALNSEA
jgi:hypothetical protein